MNSDAWRRGRADTEPPLRVSVPAPSHGGHPISVSIVKLLLELEQGGVENSFAEIQLHGLAGGCIAGRGLPVPLVEAVAQVLQSGCASLTNWNNLCWSRLVGPA